MKAFMGRLTRSAAALEDDALLLLLLVLLLELLVEEPLLLLFVLLLLLLVGVGTCVWGGEWALMLPTEAREGLVRDELRDELSDVNEEWWDREYVWEWELWWAWDTVWGTEWEWEEWGGRCAECKLPPLRSGGSRVSMVEGLRAALL